MKISRITVERSRRGYPDRWEARAQIARGAWIVKHGRTKRGALRKLRKLVVDANRAADARRRSGSADTDRPGGSA